MPGDKRCLLIAYCTESDGNAALNMENDLMMADEYGEAMSLQPSVVNARATQMFT